MVSNQDLLMWFRVYHKTTVLGPLIFLLHINNLPSVVSSKVRRFADDCLIYRNIRNKEDKIALRLLENWVG